VEEQVTSLGDVFQLAILGLVRKVSVTKPTQRAKLMKSVFYLAAASSPAVMFECAQILWKHANTPSAVQISVNAYVTLLNAQPDNNVKLVVLECLLEISRSDSHIVENSVMDILRGLSCPAVGVRERIIELVSSLLNKRNVGDVLTFVKKELTKANNVENIGSEGNVMYRRKLIATLQQACREFPSFADSVIPTLVEMLSFPETSVEVINFLREVMVSPDSIGMRPTICEQLVLRLGSMSQSKVARVALWLVGEFPHNRAVATEHLHAMLDILSPLPINRHTANDDYDVDRPIPATDSTGDVSPSSATTTQLTTRTVVLADGTYASQAVYNGKSSGRAASTHQLRALIENGDILLASVVGVVLAKLYVKSSPVDGKTKNQIILAIASLARVVKQSISFGCDNEYVARLTTCLRVVVGSPRDTQLNNRCMKEWASESARTSLEKLVSADIAVKKSRSTLPTSTRPDEPLSFRIIKERREVLVAKDPSLEETSHHHAPEVLSIPGVLASGTIAATSDSTGLFSMRLAKASPMTGLADPVYIEGFLRLVGFDLVLELTLVNRTKDTLQNLLVELCTQGADMKVVDKPSAITLGPGESGKAFATIKVGCTENGVIFGYATFDKKSALDKEWLVLNEVHADVLEYIESDSRILEPDYKTMWQEFEWENKIVINTNIATADEFVRMLMNQTRLCLVGTADQIDASKSLLGSSQFAAVNLYAKSIFGEDALVNVSLEKSANGLIGSVRIRARTQGIALSLGDRVAHIQKEHKLRGA
jgi:coatomer subunit beta